MNQTHEVEIKNTARSRNQRALEIFTRNGFTVRLFGIDNSPMFIMDDRCLLSCFINGNNLYFRPSPDSGEISRMISLTGNAFITKNEISDLLENSEHLPVYRVLHNVSRLFLVGFNRLTLDEDEKEERFPVFGLHHPTIYVNKIKADQIVRELDILGYNVCVF